VLSREYLDNRMRSTHINALTSAFVVKELKGFNSPKIESDTVTSINEQKRIGFITRHQLTGDMTHSLILQGEYYDRI